MSEQPHLPAGSLLFGSWQIDLPADRSDFATESRSAFADEGVKFINGNIAAFDAPKQAGVAVVGGAQTVFEALRHESRGWSVGASYRAEAAALTQEWDRTVERAYFLGHVPLPVQSDVVGAVNAVCGLLGVMVCAAGSKPGDLHKLWRTSDPKQYHVEHGYSCMGYEIAGGLGVKMAAPDWDVFVLVGDCSYLVMAQELLTAAQERVKLTVILVQNCGFVSIGVLSDSIGSERFGTSLRYRDPATGRNAASLGAVGMRARTTRELTDALGDSRAEAGPVLIEIEAVRSCPLRTATPGGTFRSRKSPSSSRRCWRELRTERLKRTKSGIREHFHPAFPLRILPVASRVGSAQHRRGSTPGSRLSSVPLNLERSR